jgi:hypothetical protein
LAGPAHTAFPGPRQRPSPVSPQRLKIFRSGRDRRRFRGVSAGSSRP